MGKKDIFSKILAIVGAVLVWLPLLAPVLTSIPGSLRARMFRMDYLMPAEMFPIALAGAALLLWAAIRARSRIKIIAWGLGVAVALLVGGQALAVVTGLASGETEPGGLAMVLVIASLAIYILALITIGVGGALLLRDLFKRSPSPSSSL